MSVFFFRLLFFSKIVDHLRKCATILGRERYFLILIAKNRENVFFLIKLLANTVFLLIFLLLFLHHNNFLPFCLFQTGEKKIAFKSSHFDIITFFFKIQLSFFYSSFFLSYFFAGILYWTKGTSTSCPFSSSQQISKTKLRTWLGIFFFETVSTTWDMVIFILSSRRAKKKWSFEYVLYGNTGNRVLSSVVQK